MLFQEPVEEQVGADDDGVTDVDNQLVERHHQVERDGEIIPRVEAGFVEDERQFWPVESREGLVMWIFSKYQSGALQWSEIQNSDNADASSLCHVMLSSIDLGTNESTVSRRPWPIRVHHSVNIFL